jgi:hypothetical protein
MLEDDFSNYNSISELSIMEHLTRNRRLSVVTYLQWTWHLKESENDDDLQK